MSTPPLPIPASPSQMTQGLLCIGEHAGKCIVAQVLDLDAAEDSIQGSREGCPGMTQMQQDRYQVCRHHLRRGKSTLTSRMIGLQRAQEGECERPRVSPMPLLL